MIKSYKSVKTKMLIAVGVVMTLIVLLSLAWSIYSSYEQDLRNLKAHGQLLTKVQSDTLAGPLWDMSKKQVDLILGALKSDESFSEAEVIDAEGHTVSRITHGKEGDHKKNLHFEHEILRKQDGKTERLGRLRLSLSKSSLEKRLINGLYNDLSVFIVLLGATLLTLYCVLKRLIISPLKNIHETILSQKKDDYTLKLPLNGNDEFTTFANAFNKRSRILSQYYLKVQERQKELEIANKNLKTARKDAIDANKTKSRFLANMSHELRTPLNAIIGYSELLIEDASNLEGHEFVPELLKILSSAKHLLELITDILDISKIEAGKMDVHLEKIKVPQLIREISSLVMPLIEKNSNSFKVRMDPSVKTMYSDGVKIRQNLLNLLSNAAKFTEKGRINLDVSEEGNFILFKVKDTGIGMSPAQMDKIFQAFTQADSSTTKKYGGTGLGLSITQEFCQMLGGKITVDSKIGEGSCFTMELPREVACEISPPKNIIKAPSAA